MSLAHGSAFCVCLLAMDQLSVDDRLCRPDIRTP
jgi:hypothetical protein